MKVTDFGRATYRAAELSAIVPDEIRVKITAAGLETKWLSITAAEYAAIKTILTGEEA